jgi:dTDP-4-dehydrorhamnose 3,5-epimerase
VELPSLRRHVPKLDRRGESVRIFEFGELAGLKSDFLYVLEVENTKAGTIRGLHMSSDPVAGPKVLTVTNGSIFDVLVDLRDESPTYGSAFTCTISAEDPSTLRIPAGFAHGYQTLEGAVKILYCLDEVFIPAFDNGFSPFSKCLVSIWPIKEPRLVSDKDASWPELDFERVVIDHVNYKPVSESSEKIPSRKEVF